MRLPYESTLELLNEHFNLELGARRVQEHLKNLADYYVNTKKAIATRVFESPVIHVDESKIRIQGENWYIWVFTDGKYVTFTLRETRETAFIHELLDDYKGVLVSDFYPGYDSIKCQQQKCWIHLIHNLNDDLRAAPFDTEFENLIVEIKNLIVPIVRTVQAYGLRKQKLGKFKKQVEDFYQQAIIDKWYKSDLAGKYQRHFIKYRESLFTFLEEDNIPWHNNTAERAIRHITKQRAVSNNFSKTVIESYLILLGIRQTCRFQDKSFFKFLFSGETDIDSFKNDTIVSYRSLKLDDK